MRSKDTSKNMHWPRFFGPPGTLHVISTAEENKSQWVKLDCRTWQAPHNTLY